MTPDPDSSNNESSVQTLIVDAGPPELGHGSVVQVVGNDGGAGAHGDLWRVSQQPYSSYEVILDNSSGTAVATGDMALALTFNDPSSEYTWSSALGTGTARSLRWIVPRFVWPPVRIDEMFVQVKRGLCGMSCTAADTYRLRFYETTVTIPRFNNTNGLKTVLVLNNASDRPLNGEIYSWDELTSGEPSYLPFSLNARETFVLDLSTDFRTDSKAGFIAIAHTGGYGTLTGKAVILDASSGTAQDVSLVFKPR